MFERPCRPWVGPPSGRGGQTVAAVANRSDLPISRMGGDDFEEAVKSSELQDLLDVLRRIHNSNGPLFRGHCFVQSDEHAEAATIDKLSAGEVEIDAAVRVLDRLSDFFLGFWRIRCRQFW